jgi:hypothetical protein
VCVRVAGEAPVCEVGADVLKAFMIDPLFYRSLVTLSLHPPDVRSIALVRGGAEQRVERDGTNEFRAAGAAAAGLDLAQIGLLLEQVARLRAVRFVVADTADVRPYGLEAPAATLTFGLSGGAGIGKSLLLGKEAAAGEVYAMVKGQDAVFTIERDVRDALVSPLFKAEAAAPAPPPR